MMDMVAVAIIDLFITTILLPCNPALSHSLPGPKMRSWWKF